MRRGRVLLIASLVVVAIVLAVPATASALLQNEYGMKYAGKETCAICHPIGSMGPGRYLSTHTNFATATVEPAGDYMWPAGRPTVGEMVEKSEVAFTLGTNTGVREYLVNNPAAVGGIVPVTYTEIQGSDRYVAAVNASKAAFATASTVVVATGEQFPDALGGASLAGAVNGPLLLTPRAAIPASVMAEITRLGATKIYVLGGDGAVSNAAVAQLDSSFGTVQRLAGASRYETANLIAAETIRLLGVGYTGKAFLATGANFPDALGASPIMFKKGIVLVLSTPTGAFTLPAGVTKVKVLGGTGAVPASVNTALGAKYDGRLAGTTRYQTGALVAQYGVSLGLSWNGVGLCSGDTFPDALLGGPMIGAGNSVTLLTPPASLSGDASAKLSANKAVIGKATFVGVLSTTVRNQVKAILTGVAGAGDPNPFVVPALEWDPAEPDMWDMGAEGIEWETYSCNGCHHLGFVAKGLRPLRGKFFSTGTTPTANAWATNPEGPTTSPEKYVEGASVQCEVCHGTGEAAVGVANHYGAFTDNVKILKDTQMLDSQICGQCHGSWEGGATSNMRGYTPDQNILEFGNPYDLADVPTEANWNGGIISGTTKWRFYPNGANRSAKHIYYTEWAMSGHSYRPAYAPADSNARVLPYQKETAAAFDSKTAEVECLYCHTGEAYAVRKGVTVVNPSATTPFVPTTSNSGYMGIECANCHMPHGSATDPSGMQVRTPEPGTSLLGIENTSICEDCHNWRLEVMGYGLETAPLPNADLVAEGGFMYPNREMVNGVGMFDVPDGERFMGETKCEECHMPATRSDYPAKTGIERYDERSFKRYSHRMHVMEPGDAAAWGLARWGDSCSPCHAGTAIESLQTSIETWRADVAAAAAETTAAYVAAYELAPGSAEDTDTPAFQALMGRAYYNYKNYVNDGSGGVHNPEYIIAGLEAATRMAKSVNGDFTYFGGGTAFDGLVYWCGGVMNGDGSPAAGARIRIVVDGVDHYATTDADGNFIFIFSGVLGSTTWERCDDPIADLTFAP